MAVTTTSLPPNPGHLSASFASQAAGPARNSPTRWTTGAFSLGSDGPAARPWNLSRCSRPTAAHPAPGLRHFLDRGQFEPDSDRKCPRSCGQPISGVIMKDRRRSAAHGRRSRTPPEPHSWSIVPAREAVPGARLGRTGPCGGASVTWGTLVRRAPSCGPRRLLVPQHSQGLLLLLSPVSCVVTFLRRRRSTRIDRRKPVSVTEPV
jgi:hypothetical protein